MRCYHGNGLNPLPGMALHPPVDNINKQGTCIALHRENPVGSYLPGMTLHPPVDNTSKQGTCIALRRENPAGSYLPGMTLHPLVDNTSKVPALHSAGKIL